MKSMVVCGVLLLVAGAGIVFAWQGLHRADTSSAAAAVVASSSEDSTLLEDPVASAIAQAKRPRHRPRDPAAPTGEDWLTSFELIERSGRTVSSEELKGQPYVVGFFFTLCPSICVNQNAKVKELQDSYRGQPVRLLSISCDPEVDQPPVLREYAQRFEADPEQWLFLTGEMDYISRVAAEMYFLSAERRFHAEKFVLVDAEGKNVGFYTWSDPLQFNELRRDIDKLLAGEKVQRATLNASDL